MPFFIIRQQDCFLIDRWRLLLELHIALYRNICMHLFGLFSKWPRLFIHVRHSCSYRCTYVSIANQGYVNWKDIELLIEWLLERVDALMDHIQAYRRVYRALYTQHARDSYYQVSFSRSELTYAAATDACKATRGRLVGWLFLNGWKFILTFCPLHLYVKQEWSLL